MKYLSTSFWLSDRASTWMILESRGKKRATVVTYAQSMRYLLRLCYPVNCTFGRYQHGIPDCGLQETAVLQRETRRDLRNECSLHLLFHSPSLSLFLQFCQIPARYIYIHRAPLTLMWRDSRLRGSPRRAIVGRRFIDPSNSFDSAVHLTILNAVMWGCVANANPIHINLYSATDFMKIYCFGALTISTKLSLFQCKSFNKLLFLVSFLVYFLIWRQK